MATSTIIFQEYRSGQLDRISTISAGSNVTIANDEAGTITISASGSGGSGTVTSVDVSGGTTGLTFSGGPITTSGTITMAGTLAHENGGLEADVSAYDGLLKISGGATSQITDNSTNWNTAFGWGDHSTEGYVDSASTITLNRLVKGSDGARGVEETNLYFSGSLLGTTGTDLIIQPNTGSGGRLFLNNTQSELQSPDTTTYWRASNSQMQARFSNTTVIQIDASGFSLGQPATSYVNAILDEDDMVSDSATSLATQQSIKAYVDSGLSGKQDTITFGAGVETFLGAPSSANLATAVTDETGSGSLVFATSPTLVTPALGTPSGGALTNCTALPIIAGTTGTLSVARGGTGDTTATGAATNLGLGTGDSPQFTGVNIGHATDSTITRLSAGRIQCEGVDLLAVDFAVAGSDEDAALTASTSTPVVTFHAQRDFTLTEAHIGVTTAPTGSVLTGDIHKGGTTIFSTKPTIDATEKSSHTAATAPVLSTTSFAKGDLIECFVDGIGATVAGAGIKFYFNTINTDS